MFQKSPARLTIETGPGAGTTFDVFQTKTFVGRKEGSFLVPDAKISSCHFLLEYVDGNFILVDLKSRSGTEVNGKKVQKALLRDQDLIKIGDSNLRITLHKVKDPLLTPSQVAPVKGIPKKETSNRQPDLSQEIDREINLFKAAASSAPKSVDSSGKKEARSAFKGAKIFLRVVEGPDEGKIFPVEKGSMMVGRMGADIDLTDTDVSRKHCLFEVFAPDKIYVRDLSSTNGTSVNNRAIQSCKLKSSDRIQVGETVLELVIESRGP
jgi:pSer/pThr/pTyr-binding forkhead associated (FHA) protein